MAKVNVVGIEKLQKKLKKNVNMYDVTWFARHN